MPVPLFAFDRSRYAPAVKERLAAVIDSGQFILGPEVADFEQEFASYLSAKHCIGVGNGTDALTLALRALGVEHGDEVVLPSFTFYATAEAAVNAGATPVFCDIDPDTFCVTRETVERALTPNTKAIVPVHLFGNVAPIPDLMDLGVPVLEDAAQAAGATLKGAKAGALGHAATYSFFPSKNLFGVGDGGAVITNDDEIAQRVRRLRFHGSDDKQTFVEVGYNSRLDELQAAALRMFLPELDGWNEARRAAARAYEEQGLGELVRLPSPVDGADPVYHLYVVRSERADELAGALKEAGVGARAYYRVPTHLQPSMERWGGPGLDLPGTVIAARESLAIPMGSDLDADAVAEVVAACREALA